MNDGADASLKLFFEVEDFDWLESCPLRLRPEACTP